MTPDGCLTSPVEPSQTKADTAVQPSKIRVDFRRTMQVLSRFETSFRRASWKSCSELVFPIMFGHLTFATHRPWTVYVKKAMFLAAEAWRQAYGQVATQPEP